MSVRLYAHTEPDQTWPVRKEDAPCCQARRLPDGRLPIGFCGPLCVRRILLPARRPATSTGTGRADDPLPTPGAAPEGTGETIRRRH